MRSFYRTYIESDSFNIDILHFLGGVAFISGTKYDSFAKTWYSFDDDYAQDLKRYNKAEDILQQIIIDLTK